MSKAQIVETIDALTPDQLKALESYLATLTAGDSPSHSPLEKRRERVLRTFDRVRERIRETHGVVDVSSSVRELRSARP